LKSIVFNAQQRREFQTASDRLKPILSNSAPKIVVIDGRHGVGKTTLGRFLSWRFDVTLIETDTYLRWDLKHLRYTVEVMKAQALTQLDSNKHVIIEGVLALELIADMALAADFHIHVVCDKAPAAIKNSDHLPEGEIELDNFSDLYEEQYRPKEKADLLVKLPNWKKLHFDLRAEDGL
jgi:uridine kinase